MLCDVCQRPAAGHCGECGAYFCEHHGGANCFRCSGAFVAAERPQVIEDPLETGVYTTDKRARPAGKGYLQCRSKPRMATVHLDDDDGSPPMCGACGGLANNSCVNCSAPCCPEHFVIGRLCPDCDRSSKLGVYVFCLCIGVLLALALFGQWAG